MFYFCVKELTLLLQFSNHHFGQTFFNTVIFQASPHLGFTWEALNIPAPRPLTSSPRPGGQNQSGASATSARPTPHAVCLQSRVAFFDVYNTDQEVPYLKLDSQGILLSFFIVAVVGFADTHCRYKHFPGSMVHVFGTLIIPMVTCNSLVHAEGVPLNKTLSASFESSLKCQVYPVLAIFLSRFPF